MHIQFYLNIYTGYKKIDRLKMIKHIRIVMECELCTGQLKIK